jgi:hypothetical protein
LEIVSIDRTPFNHAQADLEDEQITAIFAINQMPFASVDGPGANKDQPIPSADCGVVQKTAHAPNRAQKFCRTGDLPSHSAHDTERLL